MSPATSCLTLTLLLVGCRFGGPEGDATSLVEPDRKTDGASSDADAGFDDSEDPGPDDGDDGETTTDSGPRDAARPHPPDGGDGIMDSGEEDLCEPLTSVPGCDPVRGTGCTEGINQCVVEHGAAAPTGRCVFSTVSVGATCEQNDLSSTCPFLFTCVGGECRKYCYCDDDCPAGDSCDDSNEQGAAAVFKLCVAARP